jgi:hypothetical protein
MRIVCSSLLRDTFHHEGTKFTKGRVLTRDQFGDPNLVCFAIFAVQVDDSIPFLNDLNGLNGWNDWNKLLSSWNRFCL